MGVGHLEAMQHSNLEIGIYGLLGALIPEVLRVVTALRAQRSPSKKEWLASLLVVLLGAGVLLFDLENASRFQIAVLGSAFPSLFSSAVAAATIPTQIERGEHFGRRVVDYLGWRL
jgi:hypothetical protein